MSEGTGYILTEIWNARPSWLALPVEARALFFETKIGPLLGSLVGEGAEILACAVNDNTGGERMDYRFMAVWRLPDKGFSDRLEAAAKEAGFLDYFEQVNFSGDCITPDVLNAHMIEL
jgi:Family of unknown function (DUF6616)